jgi:PhzF family phenazine biosynthesis protein
MKIPIFQVDAFTSTLFAGNPAAVCPLPSWLDDATLQAIAAENNLSETAYLVRTAEGFDIRWFTPGAEVDLCGHATLASAWVVFHALGEVGNVVRFSSKSGVLSVERRGDLFAMDFPARPAKPIDAPEALVRALGGKPIEVRAARDYLCIYAHERDVRALAPDMAGLACLDRYGIIVTSPAEKEGCDFVSRFFAPQVGVPEDPVTGSAHCTLIPYWSERLGKTKLSARQISKRGGEIACELRGERVELAGRAVRYLEGFIEL